MTSEVRYCTTEDGVRIAYCIDGEGPPLLFCHYVYAFSLSHLVPTYNDAVQRIGKGRRLIRYDMRGTGLSQRDVQDMSPAACIRDIEAVVRALALERFAMMGAAIGGARSAEYAARHPGQVSALILYESFPRLLDVFPRELLQTFAMLARVNWRAATRSVIDIAIRTRDRGEQQQWTELIFDSVTGETMARLVEASMDLDVSRLLPGVACPTLVCHSRDEPQWPLALGQALAEGIPDARLVPLESGGAFSDPQEVIQAIEMFLAEQAPAVDPAGADGREARSLTSRETEILRLIAAGMTSKEISERLTLSVRTVGRHITNIYRKIGVNSRAGATSYALLQGIPSE
jgi:pimeloyl-ACP methyl ester carboxylesterase/DNA-binding CsgD family transcriptional regulator